MSSIINKAGVRLEQVIFRIHSIYYKTYMISSITQKKHKLVAKSIYLGIERGMAYYINRKNNVSKILHWKLSIRYTWPAQFTI